MRKTFDHRILYGQMDDGGQSCQNLSEADGQVWVLLHLCIYETLIIGIKDASDPPYAVSAQTSLVIHQSRWAPRDLAQVV